MKTIMDLLLYDRKSERFRWYFLILSFIGILGLLYFGFIGPFKKLIVSAGLTIEGMYNPDSLIDLLSILTHKLMLPILMVVGSYIMLKFIEKSDFSLIGMNFYKGWFYDLALGMVIGVLLMAVGLIIFVVFGWIDIIGLSWNMKSTSDYLYGGFYIIVSMLSVSLVEEIFLRGYIFYVLRRSMGVKYTIAITSLIFGLLHIGNSTAVSWAVYVIPITLTLAGVLLAFSFLSNESLWIAIGLHFSWNVFEYGVFNLNGGTRSLLFVTEIDGPAIFVGLPNSSFGPEVGLVGVLMMGIGILFFYRVMKAKN